MGQCTAGNGQNWTGGSAYFGLPKIEDLRVRVKTGLDWPASIEGLVTHFLTVSEVGVQVKLGVCEWLTQAVGFPCGGI